MQGKDRILITGADGLLGSSLLNELKNYYDITAVVRKPSSKPLSKVSYTIIDLSTQWEEKILPPSVDIIIHLAQSTHFRDFPNKAIDVFRVNVDSTARLLDYGRRTGAKKFIYASSGGVYGKGPSAFCEESSINRNQNLGYYLGSKLCGEVLVESYAALMEVIILRPFFMYGANQRRSMLIPRLVENVRSGIPISLQGEKGIRINPVHVEDAVRVVKKCLKQPHSQILNIAGPDIVSIKEIAEVIGLHLRKKPVFKSVSGEPLNVIGDNKRMLSLFTRPLLSIKEGVVDVITA